MTEERKLSTKEIATAMDQRAAVESRTAAPEGPSPLFAGEELNGYRARWSGIQTGFVDEPRKAVEEADALVAELMKRLADAFSSERERLESQWEKNEQVSTEDLRLAMRRYRSFFERLLSIS
jgi:enoyl-CoA hydratase/carnithine racemase